MVDKIKKHRVTNLKQLRTSWKSNEADGGRLLHYNRKLLHQQPLGEAGDKFN